MKPINSDSIYGLVNAIALSCLGEDNELMILQDTLAACLIELENNQEALSRVAVAASSAVESCGEDFLDVEQQTQELKTIAESGLVNK